jgi:antitoxin HicB
MTRDELIKRLRRLARKRGLEFDVDREHGKGSHWMVRFGSASQPVPQAGSRELAKGTLRAILRNFGLKPRDVEQGSVRLAYPIELTMMSPEDGGRWLVTFPDWNNAVTEGDDPAEAMANAVACLETMIDYCLRKGLDIPAPGPGRGRRLVAPDSGLATKAALWQAFRESGVAEPAFAAQLGLAPDQLNRRLFHPRARPRAELVRGAAAALGKRVVVELEDAARH